MTIFFGICCARICMSGILVEAYIVDNLHLNCTKFLRNDLAKQRDSRLRNLRANQHLKSLLFAQQFHFGCIGGQNFDVAV